MNADRRVEFNFVLGTAAELIKVYPVIHLAIQRGHGVRVISSGQSRENFLMQYRDFSLPENALVTLIESHGDLDKASSALRWFGRAAFTCKKSFRSKLLNSSADRSYVVVHGDTLSTLVGAWLGWRCGLPVVHVEAGLRSPNLFNPFPEEITRRLVSRFASFHMVPDSRAESNLRRASVRGRILCTQGNTLLDAVLLSAEFKEKKSSEARFGLVNIHRFENLNSQPRWNKIIDTVVNAALKTKLVFVAHPQTRHKLSSDLDVTRRLTSANIEIRERMPFSEFIGLLKHADYLISDGGSNQEECSYLGKPCMILRDSTERQEGLDGCCVLTRFDQDSIDQFLNDPSQYRRPPMNDVTSPSQIILKTLEEA